MQHFFTFQMDESLDISAVEESIYDATFNDKFECSDCDYKTRQHLKILSKSQILTPIKGCNSVNKLLKMALYNPSVDLVNDNVYTKIGQILSIHS